MYPDERSIMRDSNDGNGCFLYDERIGRYVNFRRPTILAGPRGEAPGDLGFPVWKALGGRLGMCICNDRRWPETYRVMGLQGVEMVLLGYNTPVTNSMSETEVPEHRLFHHRLSIQAGAYQNATWVVAVAKAGDEDGFPLMGGSAIVDPQGLIVAETVTEGDELITHACDLDACAFGKQTIFNFAAHRRTEHYGLITERTGAGEPLT